jgi:hypothetical protein
VGQCSDRSATGFYRMPEELDSPVVAGLDHSDPLHFVPSTVARGRSLLEIGGGVRQAIRLRVINLVLISAG